MFRPIYFSPESYPRYVGTERHIPEYFPKTPDQTPFPPIGYIPQINHTFAYLEETYGAVNEHQVAIGESTCSGVFGAIPLGAPNGTAMLSIDTLTQIAMERSTTAVQAIQLMGDLAERYGFYGAGAFEGTAESLAVSDPHEAWIFHILADPTGTSAIWVAQRVPDDAFAVLANMFVIRQVDPNDHDNFRIERVRAHGRPGIRMVVSGRRPTLGFYQNLQRRRVCAQVLQWPTRLGCLSIGGARFSRRLFGPSIHARLSGLHHAGLQIVCPRLVSVPS